MFDLAKQASHSEGSEFEKFFSEGIEELNKVGMKFVQHGDTEIGHQIFTYCEEATQIGKYGTFPLLRSQTFNNIGCLYRKVGKLKGALNHLRTALTVLNKNDMMIHSASTYLNISAVYSQLGK